MKKRCLLLVIGCLLVTLSGCQSKPIVESGETSKETSKEENSIPVVATALSNTKYAWGFRRGKDGQRPEFSADYIKVLDDYDGIYAGDPEKKVIYLTFDEGYENGYTASILDTLWEKDVTATFFVTQPYVKQNPELVKRMIEEGHIVRKSYGESSFYARCSRQ